MFFSCIPIFHDLPIYIPFVHNKWLFSCKKEKRIVDTKIYEAFKNRKNIEEENGKKLNQTNSSNKDSKNKNNEGKSFITKLFRGLNFIVLLPITQV
jgi:hypothetical protein